MMFIINTKDIYCLSIFIKIVVSVKFEVGKGFASLPTANNSYASLYNPTVVTYGLKYDPVIKSYGLPLLPLKAVGFCV